VLDAPAQDGAVFALVGAESTGKSTLAAALAQRLAVLTGWRCTWVPEYLREWCDAHGRTPQQHEQAHIAAEQCRRIDEAAQQHAVVLADTTALMTAVYHHQVFGDDSLDVPALAWQRRCRLTLLTALDLPWQADGLQRDGPQVRQPVDARLRQLLMQAGLPFVVVGGQGERRLEAGLDAIAPSLMRPVQRAARPTPAGLLSRLLDRDAAQPDWRWPCERCDQPECEHRSFRQAAASSLQRS
jgi:nicotinamide riboside kinase